MLCMHIPLLCVAALSKGLLPASSPVFRGPALDVFQEAVAPSSSSSSSSRKEPPLKITVLPKCIHNLSPPKKAMYPIPLGYILSGSSSRLCCGQYRHSGHAPGIFFEACPNGDLLGGATCSVRTVQLFGRLAVLEPHTL